MSRIVNQLIFSLLLGIFVISCQDNSGKKKVATVGSEQPANEVAGKQPVQKAGKEHPGSAVYKKYCLVCHQANGSGVPGMFPPVRQGSWMGRDPKELVHIITKGLSGKVEVDGKIYKSLMPAQAQLTDEEIADVLTYLRSEFGNSYDAIDVELVKKIRSGN